MALKYKHITLHVIQADKLHQHAIRIEI